MSSSPLDGGLMLLAIALGLLLAIAFQILLTNLGIALGLSFSRSLLAQQNSAPENSSPNEALRDTPPPGINATEEAEGESQAPLLSTGQIVSIVSFAGGIGLLLTVDSVLFAACFLAVRFSQLRLPLPAITLGLAIWAIYLILLLWLGSSALNSTADWLLGGAFSNFRSLVSLVQKVWRSPPPETSVSPEQKKLVNQLQQQLETLLAETSTLSMPLSQPVKLPESEPFPPSGSLPQPVSPPQSANLSPTDQWQQVKQQVTAQVKGQAVQGASQLLSSLNQQVQSQAQEAIDQIDLQHLPWEKLWAWAKQQRSSRKSSKSDEIAVSTYPENEIPDQQSPAVIEANQKMLNYLRYTNLSKLDLTSLDRKLDEVLAPWQSSASPSKAANPEQPHFAEAIQPAALELKQWKAQLQRRQGIKAAAAERYIAHIQKRVAAVGVSRPTAIEHSDLKLEEQIGPAMEPPASKLDNVENKADNTEGISLELQTKLMPFLAQWNLDELSLEEFQKKLSGLAWEELEPKAVQFAQALPDSAQDGLEKLNYQVQTLFSQLNHSIQQSIEASSHLWPDEGIHPLQQLRDRLPNLNDGLLAQIADLPGQTSDQLEEILQKARGQLGEQIHQAQAALGENLELLQQQALRQAEQLRRWAAIAAWWLFSLTLTSALSAAAAGYYAATLSF